MTTLLFPELCELAYTGESSPSYVSYFPDMLSRRVPIVNQNLLNIQVTERSISLSLHLSLSLSRSATSM